MNNTKEEHMEKSFMRKHILKCLLVLSLAFALLLACGKKDESSDGNDSSSAADSSQSSDNGTGNNDPSGGTVAPTVLPIQEEKLPDAESSAESTGKSDIVIDDPRIKETLDKLSKEEKIYQLFFVTPEQLANVPQVTISGPMTKNAFNTKPVGGIIYFSKNFESANQIKDMTGKMLSFSNERLGFPVFLGVDEEGGTVSRVAESKKAGVANVGNMSEIGATGNADKAYEAGMTIGKYLKDLGFNLDFAPVADVLSNSENEAFKLRSFGSDANTVSDMSVSFAKALSENKIIACYKHFPGHGAAKDDTHAGTAKVDKSLDELKKNELVPFAKAIESGADFIMIGHITVPAIDSEEIPASLSSKVINDLLRNEMGYDGIIITDSLSMKAITDKYDAGTAAVMAIKAGADMILTPADFNKAYTAVLNAVNNGEITEERLNKSVERILRLKLKMTE